MLLIIIGFIIFFIIKFRELHNIEDSIVNGFIGIWVGFIVAISIGFINLPTKEIIEKQEIIPIKSECIGIEKYVYIDNNLIYTYCINTENGIRHKKIQSDNVYIKEGDYKPSIITHKFEPKENWYFLFCIPLNESTIIEFLVPKT